MHWKGANRLYSKQSLERWSGRLSPLWEEAFDEAALRQGRTLYKKGAIREISLNEDDAIMVCRVGKSESYSVVEWGESRLNVRSSCGDSGFGEAIAVAGLLEIEELLADEDLSLIQTNEEPGKSEPEATTETTDDSEVAREGKSAARILHLVLDTHHKGLICEAYWLDEDGSRAPALSHKDGSPRANNSEERGRLIVLAARARKANFQFSSDFNGYLLEDLREVAFFIQNVWPTWRKWFSTEERANVRHIQKGIREIQLGAKAGRRRSGSLDIQWVFDSGRRILDADLAEKLMERQDEPILVPELGIVKLSSDSRQILGAWQDLESESGGAVEPYHIFSLFGEGGPKVELSEELLEWKERLLLSPQEGQQAYLDCLRPYQREGVAWMARLLNNNCHCLLADEMGLGKTLQVIALLSALRRPEERALVVCPASVVPVWISEFAKFAPDIRVGRFYGRGSDHEEDGLQVSVISYALLRSRIDQVARREFEYAIIDEAQFIKNPDSKVSRSVRRIRANKRIALTGTPIENRPLDIWPAFQFLMPGLMGSRTSFERTLAENPGASKARIKAQIAPFMLRRTKEQVAKELPEKVIIDQACPITPLQAREYSRICVEGIARLGDDLGAAIKSNRFGTLSLLTRLRQASCDPQLLPWVEAGIEESGKLMVLLEKLIEVLGTGHKVVIFSQFVRFLKRAREMIEASFPELPIFELTGSTADRETPVREFQNTEQTAAMLVSLRAASVGITLHTADYVFLLDPWWNPAVESQAIDRVHRIGQTNTVFVYRLLAEGTIEEKIRELQREKQDLFETLISDTRLGTDLVADSVKSLQALLALAQSQ